jgi:hypothetical protein
MSTLREFTNIPYDNDEDYFFNGMNKSSSQAHLPTISQIFERIRILINNSGVSSVSIGNFDRNTNGSNVANGGLLMSGKLVNSLKNDAQKPASIILKHVIMSGIDSFKSGTNGLCLLHIYYRMEGGSRKTWLCLKRFSLFMIFEFFLKIFFFEFIELMEYLKTVITTSQKNGRLLRFSSHLSLFYRSALCQLKVIDVCC